LWATASGLSPVTAAILWNTVYLSRAIDDLNARDLPVDDNLLEHLSPLGWEHSNLTGDYVWRQNRREMKPECPTVPLLLPGQ
jgi:Tn3 transposase DDE domain